MMQSANAIALSVLLATAACARVPDLTARVAAPDGTSAALVRGYESRGTLDPGILINFVESGEQKSNRSVKIHHIGKGVFGWISNREFAIVGDNIDYYSISRYLYGKRFEKRIRVYLCDSSFSDCRNLTIRILKLNSIDISGNYSEYVESETRTSRN